MDFIQRNRGLSALCLIIIEKLTILTNYQKKHQTEHKDLRAISKRMHSIKQK